TIDRANIILPPPALNTNIQGVVMGHFDKDDFDEHLGLWAIKVREHLGDVSSGRLVGDVDHSPRFGVNREISITDSGIVRIGSGAGGSGAGGGAAVGIAGVAATEASVAAALLGQSRQDHEKG